MYSNVKYLFILLLLFQYSLNSQNIDVQKLIDSLQVYETSDAFESYANILGKLLKVSSEVDSDSIDKYYKFYRDPVREKEDSIVRYAFTARGYLYHKDKNYRKTLEYFLLAFDNLENRNIGDWLTPVVEQGIGNIYTRIGDYDRAEYFYKLTERNIRNSKSFQYLPDLYINFSRLYKSKGEPLNGIRYLSDCLELNNISKDQRLASYLNLAEIYLSVDSLKQSKDALRMSNSLLNNSEEERRIKFGRLEAEYLMKIGKFDLANQNYLAAISQLQNVEDNLYFRDFAKLLSAQTENFILWGKLDLADKCIHSALHYLNPHIDSTGVLMPHLDDIYAENTFMELLEQKVRILDIKYQRTRNITYLVSALDYLDLAINANDKLRILYLLDDSKLLSIQDNKKLINKSIDLVFMLFKRTSNSDYIFKARGLFNRSKSLLLLDYINSKDRFLSLSKDKKDSIIFYKNEIETLGEQAEDKDRLNEKLISNSEKIAQLLQSDFSINKNNDLSLKYIEYAHTSTYLYSLNNFNDSLSLQRHCESGVLDSLIDQYNIKLKSVTEIESFRIFLSQLYKVLFTDEMSLPKTLKIISDGKLSAFPFESLVPDKKKQNYLLHTCELSYALHFNQLNDIDNLPSKKTEEVLIHVPTYSKKYEGDVNLVNRDELYSLYYSYEEMEAVRKHFNEVTLITNDIESKDLNYQLKGKSIYHYAGHAKVKKNHSYLTISDDDQFWIRDDKISKMNLDLNLVTLSACETGLGKFNYGEGIQSLGRSFIMAGAKSVIYSLWTVNDKSTSIIMKSLYRNLKKGMNKGQALQEAKIEFLDKVSPLERHPYYWAGFITVGDMSPIANNSLLNILPFLLLALLIIILTIFLKVKSSN